MHTKISKCFHFKFYSQFTFWFCCFLYTLFFNFLFNLFRRFLLGIGIPLIPEGEITIMIEVTIMVIEKEIGIQTQNCEELDAAIIATKQRSPTQRWSGWLPVRAVPRDHGVHIGMTPSFLTRMVQSAQIPHRVILPM